MAYKPQPNDFSTKAIHVVQDPEQWAHQSIVPPLVTSTIFKSPSLGESSKYSYTRFGNPTRDVLEKCLASLDNGKYCLVYSSAMCAIASIIKTLNTGDHLIVCQDVYIGVRKIFTEAKVRNGIEVDYIDVSNLEDMKRSIKHNTRMVWLESPTNPCMKVYDVMEISKLVHSTGNVIVCMDNTVMTPYFQKPLELEVDIVVCSVGKYISGHADVLMGSAIMNNDQMYGRLLNDQHLCGTGVSPFDCYLVNRSIKTLSMRMEKHSKSAMTVATFLESHPRVKRVFYPGLKSHPQYELMLKQTYGPSGLVSFCIDGGQIEVNKFLQSLKVFTHAKSFGDFNSLASQPTSKFNELSEAELLALGFSPSLIRISVGLEDVELLVSDLKQALESTI